MLTPPMPLPLPPKKKHRLRNLLIGIGLAVATLIGGVVGSAAIMGSTLNNAAMPNSISSSHAPSPSGSASTPAPSGPVELRLGDPASISQNGADAATVVISDPVVSSQPVDQYSEGPQNGYFVAVHVEASATANPTGGFDINPLDFYALSGSTHYDEGDGNAYEGPHNAAELNASTLNARESASGWLLFDLPAPHGKIVYAPNLDGQPLAHWKF